MGELVTALEAECKNQKLAFGLRLKFTNNTSCIYEANSLKKGIAKVLIKVAQINVDDSQDIEKEWKRQEVLTHENILCVHSLKTLQLSKHTYLCLIQDFAMTNLTEQIEKRKATRKIFEESEILHFTQSMLSALLHLQQHKLAHRDINPFNIFLSGNIPKLGNFHCMKAGVKDTDQRASLTGYHVYWSPKSREAALHQKRYVSHNIFKSDMYSLGMTVLAMAGLYDTEAMRMMVTESTDRIIRKLQYSQLLKDLLSGMLRKKQDERLSFSAAKEIVDRTSVKENSIPLYQIAQSHRIEEGKIDNMGSETCTSVDQIMCSSETAEVSGVIDSTCDYCMQQPSQPRFKFPKCVHGVCSIECWNTLYAHVSKLRSRGYECKQCGAEVSKDDLRKKLRFRTGNYEEPQSSCECGCSNISSSLMNCALF